MIWGVHVCLGGDSNIQEARRRSVIAVGVQITARCRRRTQENASPRCAPNLRSQAHLDAITVSRSLRGANWVRIMGGRTHLLPNVADVTALLTASVATVFVLFWQQRGRLGFIQTITLLSQVPDTNRLLTLSTTIRAPPIPQDFR